MSRPATTRPASRWLPPDAFDEYRLLRPLGHGTMGQVWLAQDTLLERRVAIKFIGALAGDVGARERFLLEARAIARLGHPNVVAIHRIGTIEGQPYTVTELLEGHSLDRVHKPLSPARVLAVGLDLARGLAAAHRAGVLHRDVKPANAILGPEGAKLLDFGLAKLSSEGELDRPVLRSPPVPPRPAPSAGPSPEATNPPDATRPSVTEPVAASPALTREGEVLGTPYYLAPESWAGNPATRRSDVYALGALLYELCAGSPPVRYLPPGPINWVVRAHAMRPLAEVAPYVGGALAAVIDRCLEREPTRRYASADALREALERLTHGRTGRIPEGNPYRGLLPFEAEHRALFFGRDAEVSGILERLKSGGLVVVAGQSGVGKSSLCRAGVLPRIREGGLGDGKSWLTVTCAPGRRPLRSLVSAVAGLLPEPNTLLARVRAEPSLLARELARALGPERGLTVFVDQLEEWTTFSEPEEAALAALAVSELASGIPSLRVLATLRSDLLASLTQLPTLGAEVTSALTLLGPISREHLAEVITGPARVHDVHFESDSMVRGLSQWGTQDGALPLLQFALARLWDERGAGSTLTQASLERMGGLSGALAQHADAVFARMPALEAREGRALLLALVTANDQRRTRTDAELLGPTASPARRAALHTLASNRLVMARDTEEGTAWEIAHEVILREWPALAQWLSEDVEARVVRERLQAATREWIRLERTTEALWGVPQLADAQRLTRAASTQLEADETRFLLASQRRVRVQRWRRPLGVGALVLAVLLAWSAQRWSQRHQLDLEVAQRLRAGREQLRAVSHARETWEAQRDEATHAFDLGDFSQGEKKWEHALAARETWTAAVGRAGVQTENAFLLAPERPDVRRALASVVAERVAVAQMEGRDGAAVGELERLHSLDARHELAALDAPGKVLLDVRPSSARHTLARVTLVAGRWEETGVEMTPGTSQTLPAGTYVLDAHAPGHEHLRAPFFVRANEATRVPAHLLREGALPAGFVHVPAGRFLFGAAGDEQVRRQFYEAAPLHTVFQPDFLIGQHEVTFAQWIEYLEALPPRERAQRLPRTVAALGWTTESASERLTSTPAGWRFTIVPVSHRYSALEGEPLRYLGRSSHAEQDWRRFPVTAIRPVDMAAYAAWLNQTGRVPYARLCSELEWERAARGADARTLPHAELLAPDDANLDETYGFHDAAYGPDEVGSHPGSRSPFGVDDLLGNVWEVVQAVNARKGLVVRGGSWHVGQLSARIPNSWVVNADFRQVDTGFRICADLPGQ